MPETPAPKPRYRITVQPERSMPGWYVGVLWRDGVLVQISPIPCESRQQARASAKEFWSALFPANK